MALIQPKQITKFLSGYVRVSAFSATGASSTVTTPVTTALSTAGEGGVSVPLQVFSSTQSGVVTTGANNRVEIYDATNKLKIKDGSGNEVYGRLTQSAGVYTLTYYILSTGTETAYTAFSSTSIDFEFAYQFDFLTLPSAFAIGVKSRNVSDDPAGAAGGFTPSEEAIAVTATNTLAALSFTPLASSLVLIVNGKTEHCLDSPAPFTFSGTSITWSAANAGYALATTDKVVAVYRR